MKLDKLIATIYAEQDFGRSIATTFAGIVGLTTYLCGADWVVAVFAAVIAFPVCRVVSSALHSNWKQKHTEIVKQVEATALFHKFSPEERKVLKLFVHAGGACLSWDYLGSMKHVFSRAALDSLIVRRVLRHSELDDQTPNSVVLDIETFDLAQRVFTDDDP